MKDAEIVPATPEEYRKMLDEIGLHTREVAGGIDAVWWRGMRSFVVAFRRARNGWWDVMDVNAFGTTTTTLWSSAHASEDTREFIENWIRSHPRLKR